MSTRPVVVARFSYRHEAEFGKAFLAAEGIDSAIVADDAGGAQVALSFSNSVRLLVREEDAERARAVLRFDSQSGDGSGAGESRT